MADFTRELLDRLAVLAASAVALAYLDDAVAAATRLSDRSDAEALHDFRVTIRRLRVTLRAYPGLHANVSNRVGPDVDGAQPGSSRGAGSSRHSEPKSYPTIRDSVGEPFVTNPLHSCNHVEISGVSQSRGARATVVPPRRAAPFRGGYASDVKGDDVTTRPVADLLVTLAEPVRARESRRGSGAPS